MNAQELRPMGIGDILDVTFRLYRQRFLTFLLIALVGYVPYALFMAALPAFAPAPSAAPAPGALGQNPYASAPMRSGQVRFQQVSPLVFVPAMVGVVLFVLVIFPLCSAAMIYNISASYLGETLSAGASYGRAVPRLLPLLGTNLLVGIAVLVGYAMCIVPGVIFSLWFMLIAPVVVLELAAGPTAMRRSRELMRGNVGKGFALMLVVGILCWIVNMAIGAVVGLVPWPHHALPIFVQNLAPAVLLPVQTAAAILLYYDLRIRKEAFDLQRLSETLGQPAAT